MFFLNIMIQYCYGISENKLFFYNPRKQLSINVMMLSLPLFCFDYFFFALVYQTLSLLDAI